MLKELLPRLLVMFVRSEEIDTCEDQERKKGLLSIIIDVVAHNVN